MATHKPVHVTLPPRQIRQLAKLSAETGLDRSNLIRLAVAHLIEDEKSRAKAAQRDRRGIGVLPATPSPTKRG